MAEERSYWEVNINPYENECRLALLIIRDWPRTPHGIRRTKTLNTIITANQLKNLEMLEMGRGFCCVRSYNSTVTSMDTPVDLICQKQLNIQVRAFAKHILADRWFSIELSCLDDTSPLLLLLGIHGRHILEYTRPNAFLTTPPHSSTITYKSNQKNPQIQDGAWSNNDSNR